MLNKSKSTDSSRRQFLSKFLPLCAISCFGFNKIALCQSNDSEESDIPFETRIQRDYGKSVEDVWRLRYNYYINTMEFLGDELGRNILIDLLKKKHDVNEKENSSDNPENTFSKYTKETKEAINGSYRNKLEVEIVADTEKAFEVRISKCIWAKTFLAKDAGDIGYASLCYGDFASAKVYNNHLQLRLTKTLMNGDEFCNHRFTWKG